MFNNVVPDAPGPEALYEPEPETETENVAQIAAPTAMPGLAPEELLDQAATTQSSLFIPTAP